uniref:Uncharacterized protein n=1 Tax=Oryza meridionalis TaxID=40149 RepID=A0A0E0F0G7_9ORYZ
MKNKVRWEDWKNGCSCPRLLLPGICRNRLRPCRAVLSQVACASGVVLPAVPRQHLLVHLLIVGEHQVVLRAAATNSTRGTQVAKHPYR